MSTLENHRKGHFKGILANKCFKRKAIHPLLHTFCFFKPNVSLHSSLCTQIGIYLCKSQDPSPHVPKSSRAGVPSHINPQGARMWGGPATKPGVTVPPGRVMGPHSWLARAVQTPDKAWPDPFLLEAVPLRGLCCSVHPTVCTTPLG